jgi:hypothetical protein
MVDRTVKRARTRKSELQCYRECGRQGTKLIIYTSGHKLILRALGGCSGNPILWIQAPYGLSIAFLGNVEMQLYATISPSTFNSAHDVVPILF